MEKNEKTLLRDISSYYPMASRSAGNKLITKIIKSTLNLH